MVTEDKAFRINEDRITYSALRSLTPDDIIGMARVLLTRRFRRGKILTSPSDTKDYLVLKLGSESSETFACLFLDTRHRVIRFEKMFQGTIDGAVVHPREVVKKALRYNAASVIFAHNHPSGAAEPSQADQQLTRRLKDALSLIDVRVLDHIVVGGTETVSFAERGLL